MDVATMLFGLLLAACGHALLHDWRGIAAVYEDIDDRFPPAMQTPLPVAGPLLLLTGAACALAPMVG